MVDRRVDRNISELGGVHAKPHLRAMYRLDQLCAVQRVRSLRALGGRRRAAGRVGFAAATLESCVVAARGDRRGVAEGLLPVPQSEQLCERSDRGEPRSLVTPLMLPANSPWRRPPASAPDGEPLVYATVPLAAPVEDELCRHPRRQLRLTRQSEEAGPALGGDLRSGSKEHLLPRSSLSGAS